MSEGPRPKAPSVDEISTWVASQSAPATGGDASQASREPVNLLSIHTSAYREQPVPRMRSHDFPNSDRAAVHNPPTAPIPRPYIKLRRYSLRVDTYNGLFVTVMAINAVALVPFAIRTKVDGDGPLRLRSMITAVSANFFLAVLIRQEIVVNIFYALLTQVPPSAPFLLRKHLTNFHHFGGIHAACAVSALLWYIGYLYLQTQALLGGIGGWRSPLRIVDIGACYVILLLLVATILTALPRIRRNHHDVFERVHRFAGWATVTALWFHTLVGAIDPASSLGTSAPARDPVLYLLALITIMLMLPWLRIRKVAVTAHPMSGREIRLSFPYSNMPPTSTLRFSLSPLTEWHSFATIPSTPNPDSNEASIIVADAGDWTRALIANPPTHLWMRGPPLLNFLSAVPLFDRVLLVATGAGIGPVLSLLGSLPPGDQGVRRENAGWGIRMHRKRHTPGHIKVLWVAYRPYAPHYGFAVHEIRRVDPDAVIFDSRQRRPDIPAVVAQMVKGEDIEAIFVVSNRGITERVVGAARSGRYGRGVAGYGAVFDS